MTRSSAGVPEDGPGRRRVTFGILPASAPRPGDEASSPATENHREGQARYQNDFRAQPSACGSFAKRAAVHAASGDSSGDPGRTIVP